MTANASIAKQLIETLPSKDRAALLAELSGQKDQEPARLLRHAEVARRLGVGRRTVNNLARRGVLHRVILPGNHRALGFREEDVALLIAGRG